LRFRDFVRSALNNCTDELGEGSTPTRRERHYTLMTQIRADSVVLFHDTCSSTVDVVYQFISALMAKGYHL
jgi:hypothetical protein